MRSVYVLRCGVLGFLLGAWPLIALGQPFPGPDTTRGPDLAALLAELDASNPTLRAARLEAVALGTHNRQTSALPDPTFMVSYQPFPMLTGHGFQRTMWSVEQMIPFPGKRGLQGDVADLGAAIASFEAETLAQDLKLQAKQLYYELYRIQEQDRLVTGFQQELRNFEEVAITRYEVGIGTQQDILKAQVEQNRLNVRLEQLAAAHRSAREMLARLLDRPDAASLAGPVRLGAPPVEAVPDALLDLALARRPEVRALATAEDRAARRLDLAHRAFWPDFMVNLTYFDMRPADAPPTADGTDAFGIGMGIRVPLWRGKLRAGLEEARVRQQQAATRTEALTTALRTQLDDLTQQLDRQRRQLDLFRSTLLPQAETALEATLSAYNTGRTSFLDLLDAERTLFDLRRDEVDLYTHYLQTAAALERALGVASLNELYDHDE